MTDQKKKGCKRKPEDDEVSFQISVKGNKTITVDAGPKTTVVELMRIIEQRLDIPMTSQIFMSSRYNMRMYREATLEEAGIGKEITLDVGCALAPPHCRCMCHAVAELHGSDPPSAGCPGCSKPAQEDSDCPYPEDCNCSAAVARNETVAKEDSDCPDPEDSGDATP